MKKLRYNNPLSTYNPVIHQDSIITEEEAIKYMRWLHPQITYTDKQALDEFIVVNWAWYVEEND